MGSIVPSEVDEMVSENLPVEEIFYFCPHRYPLILLDRILEVRGNKTGTALKNVSMNEPWVTGHFPGNPVFPGVFMIEAAAQLAGLVVGYHASKLPQYLGIEILFLAGVNNVKIRKPAVPGDQLLLHAENTKVRKDFYKFAVKVCCKDDLVADMALTLTLKMNFK